jgi:hypothetical protein
MCWQCLLQQVGTNGVAAAFRVEECVCSVVAQFEATSLLLAWSTAGCAHGASLQFSIQGRKTADLPGCSVRRLFTCDYNCKGFME